MDFRHLILIGKGFWNLRAPFPFLFGLVDVFSLFRLSTGRFLVIDTCSLSQEAKVEVDKLTENGTLIDAVVATHPFHTLAFVKFHSYYPNAKYYGTPRHLLNVNIPWAGDVNEVTIREMWEPEVSMRIPAGAEFVNPVSHFSSLFVFHRESKTIHDDDTICFSENPGFVAQLAGLKPGSMFFHVSLKTDGLYPTEEAPLQFKEWVLKLITDWDFDNICTAHKGNKIGGAKELLMHTIEKKYFIDDVSETLYCPRVRYQLNSQQFNMSCQVDSI
eukprot:gene3004-5887_t